MPTDEMEEAASVKGVPELLGTDIGLLDPPCASSSDTMGMSESKGRDLHFR